MYRVLEILLKGDSRYNLMFKKTKVSHITLQNTLKYLVEKKFIVKNEYYGITDKGKRLLNSLEDLQKILR